MDRPPVVAAYGGGTNSTAMLVGMVRLGEPVDLILFADVGGGERPETYAYIQTFDAWLKSKGFPGITIVQRVSRKQVPLSLEQLCLEKGMLPSLAYGFKSCSMKHKADPQIKYVNHWQPAQDAWRRGEKVVKLLGFDAGEHRRVANAEARADCDRKYEYRFPLVEWGWGREQCVEAVRDAGLPLPGKSSCFFCPAMRKSEIIGLAARHPDLLQRALDLEDAARPNLTSVKGLGRRFAWRDFCREQGLLAADGKVKAGRVPLAVIPSEEDAGHEVPCECFDGCSVG